jgi:hypothetical protein
LPTFFDSFIDELGDWIREDGRGGIHPTSCISLLLFYADDVFLAKHTCIPQRLLDALNKFCRDFVIKVNIYKQR